MVVVDKYPVHRSLFYDSTLWLIVPGCLQQLERSTHPHAFLYNDSFGHGNVIVSSPILSKEARHRRVPEAPPV